MTLFLPPIEIVTSLKTAPGDLRALRLERRGERVAVRYRHRELDEYSDVLILTPGDARRLAYALLMFSEDG